MSWSPTDLFAYDKWPTRADWGEAGRPSPYDRLDFHVDLGCGKLPKARIGVDRYPAPGVNVVCDLERGISYGIPRHPGQDAAVGRQLWDGLHEYPAADVDHPWREPRNVVLRPGWRLPFADHSIESIISHHFFEHMGNGFIPLMDDIYRVLVPGGILRVITPLFPSWSAVSDPDHRRYFMAAEVDSGEVITTWDSFCGTPDNCWLESFSVPYTRARFEKLEATYTAPVAPELQWTPADARELRVALRAVK